MNQAQNIEIADKTIAFMKYTNCTLAVARHFLEGANWNFDDAIREFRKFN